MTDLTKVIQGDKGVCSVISFSVAVGVKFATVSLDYSTRCRPPEKELARREQYAKSQNTT